MTIRVTFDCGGCDATAEGTRPLRTEFISLSGQDHGLGSWHVEPATAVKPDGWLGCDPYTGCTYCPDCWDRIESAPVDTGAREQEEVPF